MGKGGKVVFGRRGIVSFKIGIVVLGKGAVVSRTERVICGRVAVPFGSVALRKVSFGKRGIVLLGKGGMVTFGKRGTVSFKIGIVRLGKGAVGKIRRVTFGKVIVPFGNVVLKKVSFRNRGIVSLRKGGMVVFGRRGVVSFKTRVVTLGKGTFGRTGRVIFGNVMVPLGNVVFGRVALGRRGTVLFGKGNGTSVPLLKGMPGGLAEANPAAVRTTTLKKECILIEFSLGCSSTRNVYGQSKMRQASQPGKRRIISLRSGMKIVVNGKTRLAPTVSFLKKRSEKEKT